MGGTRAIEIDSLSKIYDGLRAVDDVSLAVERGEVFGLFGPNGSGKTTTLECALGLQLPTRGSIRVFGEPARRMDRVRGRVAAVFDTPAFVEGLRVDENLEYALRSIPGEEREGRGVPEVLELVGASDLGSRRAGKLSLGQRKRVAVARALLGAPDLLILDEPLSGLDTFGVRRMLELLKRLAGEGITLLLSSHRLREMESIVTRVGILHGGRLVREGPLEQVLERQQVLIVQVSGLESAEAVLESLPGLEVLRRQETADGRARLELRPGSVSPELLNRRLVEGGASVSELVLSGGTLDSIFDALLRDEQEGEPCA